MVTETEEQDVIIRQQQFILDELGRMNAVLNRLVTKGVLNQQDLSEAQLETDIEKLMRKINILKIAGHDVSELERQLTGMQEEYTAITEAVEKP